MPLQEKLVSLQDSRAVLRIQSLTLIWMTVEAIVSLAAAWTTRSSALLAFGGDSAVELLSAIVVFRFFYLPSLRRRAEHQVNKIAGGLLFALAAFVAIESVLSLLGRIEARQSVVGMILLALAAIAMPWLAAQKRRLSAATHSDALRADAAESEAVRDKDAVCGYLAVIALVGLVVNAVWKIRWADPLAAVALLPFILHEGWEASKGRPCREGR